MKGSKKKTEGWLREAGGPTAIGYVIMLAVILVVLVGAVTPIGGTLSSMFTSLGSALPEGL